MGVGTVQPSLTVTSIANQAAGVEERADGVE